MSSQSLRAEKKHERTPPEPLEVALGAFGAVVGGLYALVQRELLAEQIMFSVFGEGWRLADVLLMLVAPALSICLVPLSAAIGAASVVLLARWLTHIFRRDSRRRIKNVSQS